MEARRNCMYIEPLSPMRVETIEDLDSNTQPGYFWMQTHN